MPMKPPAAASNERAYRIRLAAVYPMYVQKAERKGRTKAEVDRIIQWLTGHTAASLRTALASDMDLEAFYKAAPKYNPKSALVTGVICGVRVEDIEDQTMQRIRQLDKLIDELAKRRPMEKILRA